MDYYILIGLIGVLIGLLYVLGVKQKNHFSKYNVPFMPFKIPILGNMWNFITFKTHFKDFLIDSYNQFPNDRFYGVYQFVNPFIFVRDLELIKQITVKDFDHFQDHMIPVDEHIDKLFGLGLFNLKGQKWKDMRSTLSPAFTSMKMKHLFSFVSDSAESTTNFLVKEMDKPKNKDCGYVEVEMKDLSTRYTNDAIASAVFGIKVDSSEDPENLFYNMGKKITNFDLEISLKFMACMVAPRLVKLVKMKLFSPQATDFFFGLVNNTMEERQKHNIVRPDMIHLLMEAKKGTLKHETHSNDKDTGFASVDESEVGKKIIKREWTDDELAAQAVVFFFAGFESTSTLLCFVAHELALNTEIQERLQEEIDAIGPKLEYQDLLKMKYMDMVVSETLRKWPPAITSDRKCTRNYKLPPANDSTDLQFHLEAGRAIQIPIIAIHHDPQYYPDPERFDPERFSEENKGNIHPYAFLPFGVGPRNCIGSRFALMQTKAFIFHLLSKFNFVVIPSTQIPLKLKNTSFNLHSEKGFWIGLKPRAGK